MADISSITVPGGTTYNIKDSTARNMIPAVTTSDNGKVLTVVDGAWAKTAVTALRTTLCDMIYPVGSIYLSVVSISPEALFGGAWTRIQDQFLLAAGSTYAAGTTGGAASVTLTENEIPAHTHGSKSISGSFAVRHASNGATVAAGSGAFSISASGSGSSYPTLGGASNQVKGDLVKLSSSHTHTSVGGGGAHENMPPYISVYVWQRIA